ncbi:hypothetical protein BJX70DRAFT_404723 [Aspergillus crustosus]
MPILPTIPEGSNYRLKTQILERPSRSSTGKDKSVNSWGHGQESARARPGPKPGPSSSSWSAWQFGVPLAARLQQQGSAQRGQAHYHPRPTKTVMKIKGPDEEEHPMKLQNYVERVGKLRFAMKNGYYTRDNGHATSVNPRITWLCDIPEGFTAEHMQSVDNFARQACYFTECSHAWVRMYDHMTTRIGTVTKTQKTSYKGPGRAGPSAPIAQRVKVYGEDDRHITVSLGDSTVYIYEGHLYCMPHPKTGLPYRFSEPHERTHKKLNEDPPIILYDRRHLADQAYARGLL